MFSESKAVFPNRCLREIPAAGRIEDIESTKEQVLELISDTSLAESDLDRGWARFFDSRSKDVVENGINAGETVEIYRLDPEIIANDWADGVNDNSWFSKTRLEQIGDENWCFIAQSDRQGELTFRLFFNGRQVGEYSPDTLKNNFAAWLAEPRHIPGERATFRWAEFLQDDSWENLQCNLLRTQGPRTVDIRHLGSVAAGDNMKSIEDAIKYKFRDLELEIEEDPREGITGIEEYIDEPILLGAKEDQDPSYLVVRECGRSPNRFHLHYACDGRSVYLSDSNHAGDVREFTRSKVKQYNELFVKKKDVLPIPK